jgi:hypothetical protein
VKDLDITYREMGGPGSPDHEVLSEGRVIGRVQRFTMSAGQFGTTWTAIAGSGEQQRGFPTRESAAAWLIDRGHH